MEPEGVDDRRQRPTIRGFEEEECAGASRLPPREVGQESVWAMQAPRSSSAEGAPRRWRVGRSRGGWGRPGGGRVLIPARLPYPLLRCKIVAAQGTDPARADCERTTLNCR